jgi:hypothetical protein
VKATPEMLPPPLELRCSALPLAFICPGSVRPEGLVVDESGAESALGTAAHEGLAELAESGTPPWGETGELARRYRVDERDVRALLALGARLWRDSGGASAFPAASTEHALSYTDPDGAFVLTGHADVLSWLSDLVRIGDWKTGRRDADFREQLMGYCVLALEAGRAFGVARAEAVALWVRDGEVERHTMRRADVAAWLDRVRRVIVEWDGRYHAGRHCPHCPRSHECPAGRALVRRDVAAMADEGLVERLGDSALASLGPDGIVALLARADLAASVAERVRNAIRSYVQRNGDVVGGGRRLTLQVEERRELDVLDSFPVLYAAGFDDDDLAKVITLSLAAAERVAAKKAGRGKGAAASRALVEALETVGAVAYREQVKLVTKRE